MTTRALTISATALCVLATALAGCGIRDPYNDTTTPKEPTPGLGVDDGTTATATENSEVDGLPLKTPVPSTDIAAKAADKPAKAAADYALASANWTYTNYRKQYLQLIGLAADPLRRDLRRTVPGDDALGALAAQKQTNRAELLVSSASSVKGSTATVYVLTNERAGAGGVEDTAAHHVAYVATVKKVDGGWLVSAFNQLP